MICGVCRSRVVQRRQRNLVDYRTWLQWSAFDLDKVYMLLAARNPGRGPAWETGLVLEGKPTARSSNYRAWSLPGERSRIFELALRRTDGEKYKKIVGYHGDGGAEDAGCLYSAALLPEETGGFCGMKFPRRRRRRSWHWLPNTRRVSEIYPRWLGSGW